jgi:hypothetical protein
MIDVTLRSRKVLHRRTPDSLEHRVSLGEPHATRLLADNLDAVAADYLRSAEQQATFYLLSLFISFRPQDDAPLVSADVSVLLTHDGPANLAAPIAWSMDPTEVSEPVKARTEVAFTASLGLVKAEVSRTIGSEPRETFLLGLGERQSNPEWQFRTTSGQPQLTGLHRLTTVVCAPSATVCQAGIIVAATVRKRRAGLFHYRAELPTSMAQVRFPPP